MGIETSKGHNKPDEPITMDERTKTEVLPEYTSQSDDNKPSRNAIAAGEIAKLTPGICAFVNSKYGEPSEPPKSSEPSEPSEDSKS